MPHGLGAHDPCYTGTDMAVKRSVEFFEAEFQKQVSTRDFALNPFEEAALPHVSGRVLDLACGLGNLSVAAARCGCEVVAVDASPTAIERWAILLSRQGGFAAPKGMAKRFATVIARKP